STAPAAVTPPVSASADARRDQVATMARTVSPRSQPKDAAGLSAPQTEPPAQDAAASRPAPAAPSAAAPMAAAKALAAAPAASAGVRVGGDAARSYAASDETRARKAAPLLIASPTRESQWRIVDGAVERTEDGGATWQPQALGVDVAVRAGAAPAARVCWLAGAGGLVLLTTDATHWRRIEFPESIDLVAIEATDASHATVTTATGRRFSTSDGGTTWVLQ